jgi:hypothetical protein
VRDTEEVREARGVGAFSDAGAAKENPLDRVVVMAEREGLSVKGISVINFPKFNCFFIFYRL